MAQKPYTDQPFPGWRISPDGSEFKRFETAEDMPAGWLRETPDSFAKKGLGKPVSKHPTPVRPVSDEHSHEPAATESRGPGRPKKLDL